MGTRRGAARLAQHLRDVTAFGLFQRRSDRRGAFDVLHRLGTDAARVPAPGERVRLALAGNHAQGTIFLDGAALITPVLADRIDEIARQVPGFYIGRFVIRYRDRARFMRGLDFVIVDLNRATAESTNVCDPACSLLSAYRTLFKQWSLVFSIGDANRRRGARVTPLRRLVRPVHAHLTTRLAYELSD